ncbi:MAG: phosphate ABC transporter permease PtsA, partial [Candidatus Adiutrix sp.]|nr:phosphate ABC transporter permease PtsA [Candidatus Adiutrix sp.]
MKQHIRQRKIKNITALTLACLCSAVGLFLLFVILYDVLKNGLSAINWRLFLDDPAPPAVTDSGGLKSAFLGQGLLTLTAALVGVPIGVLGGTFLAEYGRHLKISKIISTLSDIA